jgi:O-antigen/teichoic acid export membrane protein
MTNKKLFIKNAFSGVFQKIIVAILTFFTIPVFMIKLGTESYGIFATVSVIGDLSRIANIGFHIALIKYLSLQGRTKESSIDIIVAFTGMVIMIVPVSVLMVIFNHYVLVNILNVPLAKLEQSKVLYMYLVFSNMLLFLGLTFSAILESLKMIYKTNTLQLMYSIIYWSLMLVALYLGKGLETIGVMAFIAAMVWFLFIAYLALREWGQLSINGITKLYWNSVKKQLSYGLQIYASGLMGLFGEPVIKVLVANYFGSAAVGFMDVGMRIRNQLYRVFQAALWPLFQLFSEIKEKESKARIVKDVQEKIALIILPICLLMLFGAKPFVTIWIGHNIDVISTNIIVLTMGALLAFLVFQAMNNYLGVDHPLVLLLNSTMINVISLGVIYLLHGLLGYQSVYLAFILVYIANIIFMLLVEKRFLDSVIFGSRSEIIKLVFFISIMLLTGWSLSLLIKPPIILLVILGMLVPVLSVILYVFLGLLTPSDIDRYLGNKFITKPFKVLFKWKNARVG